MYGTRVMVAENAVKLINILQCLLNLHVAKMKLSMKYMQPSTPVNIFEC